MRTARLRQTWCGISMHREDFPEVPEPQRGRILHVHVKDFVRKPGRDRSRRKGLLA